METSFDIDQTQAIALDDFEEEDDRTDELEPDEEKKPVAHLKVLLQKGLTETTFSLYEGDNVVGRDESTCHVCIPSKSLSKEHACIQIVGDSHLIYDKGSRNKTRRGKLYLSPDVRYELKHEDEIIFADVKCVYQIQELVDTVAESGSETDGSDSLLLKHDVTEDSDISGRLKNGHDLDDKDNFVIVSTQTDSGGQGRSSVIVKDTPEAQKTGSKLQGAGPIQTLVLSESESEEEDSATGKRRQQKSIIQETLLCEDSDPEASRDQEALGAATQAYVVRSDDEESSKEDIIGAPTQAYGEVTIEVGEEEGAASETLLCEPTQAFMQPTKSSRSKVGQQKSSSRLSSPPLGNERFDGSGNKEGTQVFEEKENKTTAPNDSADSATRATQVFDEEDEDEDIGATGLFAVSTMAVDLDDDDGDDDEIEVLAGDEPTQLFDSAESGVKRKQDKNANSETVVIEADGTLPVSAMEKFTEGQKSKKRSQIKASDAPTQAVSDTLPVSATKASSVKGKTGPIDSSNLPTQVFDETLPAPSEVGNGNGRKAGNDDNNAPTLAVDNTLPVTEVTQKAMPGWRGRGRGRKTGTMNQTVVTDTIVLEEEEAVVGLDEPTQAFDPSPARKRRGQRNVDTVQVSDTVVIDEEENDQIERTPTKKGKGKGRRAHAETESATIQIMDTVVIEEEEKVDQDEPTQAYETIPVKRGRGSRTHLDVGAAAVQISDTVVLEEEEIGDQDEPTQAYNTASAKRGRGRGRGRARRTQQIAQTSTLVISDTVAIVDSDEDGGPTQAFEAGPDEVRGDISTEPTQAYRDVSDEPTQAYGTEENEATNTHVRTSARNKQLRAHPKRGSQHEISTDEDTDGNISGLEKAGKEPTQAYCVSDDGATQPYGVNDDDEDDDDKNSDDAAAGAEEPTQAYGLGADDEDGEATQAYGNSDDDGDNENTTDHAGSEDPTQKYDINMDEADLKKTTSTALRQKESDMSKRKDETNDESDSDEESMLKINPDTADDERQLLTEEGEKKGQEPTLAYDLAVEDKLQNGRSAAESTLAYDIAVEEEPRKMRRGRPAKGKGGAKKAATSPNRELSPEVSRQDKNNTDEKSRTVPATGSGSALEQLSDTETMVPDSMDDSAETDVRPPVIRLPSRSPLKSNLVDRKRSPSPVPKHVAFAELPAEKESSQVSPHRGGRLRGSPSKDTGKPDTSASSSPQQGRAQFKETSSTTSGEKQAKAKQRKEISDLKPKDDQDKLQVIESDSKNEVKEGKAKESSEDKQRVASPSRRTGLRKASAASEADTSSAHLDEQKEKQGTAAVTTSPVKVRQGRSAAKGGRKSADAAKPAEGMIDQSSSSATELEEILLLPPEILNGGRAADTTETDTKDDIKIEEAVRSIAKRSQRSTAAKAESDINSDMQTGEVTLQRATKRGAVEQSKAAPLRSKKAKVSGTTAERARDDNETDETASIASSVASNEQKVEDVKVEDEGTGSQRRSRATRANIKKDEGGSATRVSSRGRRISNNPYLKDFETTGSTGKQGRSSSVTTENESDHKDLNVDYRAKAETPVSDAGDQKKVGKSSKRKQENVSKTVLSMGPPVTAKGRQRGAKAQVGNGSQDETQSSTDEAVASSADESSKKEEEEIVERKEIKQEHKVAPAFTDKPTQNVKKRGRKTSKLEEKIDESPIVNVQAESQSDAELGVRGRGRRGRASAATAELSQTLETSTQSVSDNSRQQEKKGKQMKRSQESVSPASSVSDKSQKLTEESQASNLSSASQVKSASPSVTPRQANKTRKAIGRGRKSVVPESSIEDNSCMEGDSSQGSMCLSRRAGGDVEMVDHQESSQTSATKRRAKTLSQPSPSPSQAKRTKMPASPHTPLRKSSDAAVSHSPSLRKSTLEHKPKVMFTGVIDEHGEKTVKELGGELAASIQDCSHLVTDKVRRTVKFLSGLAKGIHIVSPQWLESCKQAGTFLDGSKFLVSDPAMEKQYKFSLATSINKAAHSPVLAGYRVHVSKSVRPDPAQMQDILLCAGAEYVKSMPSKFQEKTVVVSCSDDQKLCQPAIKAGIPVVEAEFILTGILRQEVDINSFALFTQQESSSQAGATRKGRKK